MPYDYTADDRAPAGEVDLDQFEIPDVETIHKSADQLYEENSGFTSIPVGVHVVEVIGFMIKKGQSSPFTRIVKDQFVNGKRESLDTNAITVKLGLVGNKNAQVLVNFWLPPSDPAKLRVYYEGASKDGGKAGFMAGNFYRFIESIGFPYPPGGSLPPEARKIKNWIGRQVKVEVVKGQAFTDQTTGEEKTGANQVAPYKFWAVGSTSGPASGGGVNRPAPASNAVKQPTRQTVAAGRNPSRGLENI